MEAFRRYQEIAEQILGKQPVVSKEDTNGDGNEFDSDLNAPTKWNGWGFLDTRIQLNERGQVEVTGKRYAEMFPSERVMPKLRAWTEDNIGIDVSRKSLATTTKPCLMAPLPLEAFVTTCTLFSLEMAKDDAVRIEHGHGHTCKEIFRLRHGSDFGRLPDLVVWPTCHEDVEKIVNAAVENNVCIIPYGGGTSVSNAIQCVEGESRPIVSVDMRKMKRILSLDKENMVAVIEAGIVGLELHRELNCRGVTMGHEPDSWEFSTLGGWVSTRASGMKKNRYGNIEDLVLNIKMVTPTGTIVKSCNVPRVSMGPDFTAMILGSEGILGIVTTVTVRLCHIPKKRVFDSLLFPTFSNGVAALQDIAQLNAAPASIRLMDNIQFQLGAALKPSSGTPLQSALLDMAKKAYVIKYKGFKPDKLCAATLLFEGNEKEIAYQQSQVFEVAAKYGAMRGGAENGHRGYFLTYIIAYLRDFAFDYYFLSESFESTVPWNSIVPICTKVKSAVTSKAKTLGVKKPPLVCFRVTQVYQTGACIYVYFGMNYDGLDDPLAVFEALEEIAINLLYKNGASLSHHHGIGKHRLRWLPNVISNTALTGLRAVKDSLDPQNIFGVGNILPPALPSTL